MRIHELQIVMLERIKSFYIMKTPRNLQEYFSKPDPDSEQTKEMLRLAILNLQEKQAKKPVKKNPFMN
jgi:hypothetical protein